MVLVISDSSGVLHLTTQGCVIISWQWIVNGDPSTFIQVPKISNRYLPSHLSNEKVKQARYRLQTDLNPPPPMILTPLLPSNRPNEVNNQSEIVI